MDALATLLEGLKDSKAKGESNIVGFLRRMERGTLYFCNVTNLFYPRPFYYIQPLFGEGLGKSISLDPLFCPPFQASWFVTAAYIMC